MIIIAGAGISGLSLGFHLQKAGKEFMLIDPAAEAGGKIKTICQDGYQMDVGPNTLLADAAVMEFLESAGLADSLEFPAAISDKRFIFRNGRFHGLSRHPLSLLFTPLLSWKAKLRILRERWIPAAPDERESLADFVRRRFGREALDWLASPVQYGIHAADPEKLLVADAFPSLWQMEKQFGSVFKGLAASGGTARARTLNFKGGMQSLPKKLAQILGQNFHPGTSLLQIKKTETGWNCLLKSGEESHWVGCEALVFCMPAPEAGKILEASGFSRQAEALKGVHYNPMALAHMAFSKKSDKEFAGFGGLVPAAAGFRSAGAIWTSSLFEGRQPKDQHLLTAFYGGALHPEAAGKTKEEIEAVLQEENQILFGRKAEGFPHTEIWQQGIPQYDAGRRQAEEVTDALKTERIFFLANWKGGIGLSDCIRNAAHLAEKLIKQN